MPGNASAIRAGRAFVEIYADDKKLQRGLRNAQRKLKAIGSTISSIGVGFTKLGASVVAPLAAAINSASRLQEVMSKFDTVFAGNAAAVKAWGDEFASQVGRSQRQVAEFLAETQDLFVPLGFDEQSATDMSKQLTTLAVDLASFNNKADGDVLRDLQAALTGSGEVMKKYGVLVSEAAVKQELLNQKIDPKVATNQQKVMARLNIIMAGTTAAQGDAIRTSGSFANQMKALTGRIEDASSSIGQALLPVVTPLVEKFSKIIGQVVEWSKANRDVIVTIAKVAAGATVAGAALIALGKIVGGLAVGFGVLAKAAELFGVALTFLSAHPVIAALSVITGGVLLLHTAFRKSTAAANEFADAQDRILEAADKQRRIDTERIDRLGQLAKQEKLTNEQTSEANDLIDALQGRFGDLGLQIDNATNRVVGFIDAQKQMNAVLRDSAIRDLKERIAAGSEEYARLRKEAASFQIADLEFQGFDAPTALALGNSKQQAVFDQAEAALKSQYKLRERLADLEAGDTAAITGSDPTAVETQTGIVEAHREGGTALSAYIFDAMRSGREQIGAALRDGFDSGAEAIKAALEELDRINERRFAEDERAANVAGAQGLPQLAAAVGGLAGMLGGPLGGLIGGALADNAARAAESLTSSSKGTFSAAEINTLQSDKNEEETAKNTALSYKELREIKRLLRNQGGINFA